MWTHYYSVTSIDEAVQLLAEKSNRARIISGGTDILLEIERGTRPHIDTLIDISRIPDLQEIVMVDGTIHIGALVTHNQVVAHPTTREYALPLAQACWEVGAPQIRNRGTVAGNVITASPANDTITPLFALNASVTLKSVNGSRTIPIQEFYTGYRQTVMRSDEMLTAIQIPAMAENQAGIFLKLALRRAQAISVMNIAAVLTFENERTSTITSASMAMGCVAPTIIRLPEVENFLTGKTLTDETIKQAAEMASKIPQPISDIRSPAAYRTEMIKVYVSRVLKALRDGEERACYPQNPAMLWGKSQGRIEEALPQQVHYKRDQADTILTTVNGQTYSVNGGTHKTLLRFLREDLKLIGTKEGCAEGECGACTVFLDGMAVMACMIPAPRAHGAEIITVEGLAQGDQLHPLQKGFVEAGAVQCGYCTPGFVMAGAKLLEEHPQPEQAQIEQSISGNLCRCTGYYKILEAFRRT